MLAQNIVTDSPGQFGRAVLKHQEGFLNAGLLAHSESLSQSSLQYIAQTSLRASSAKIIAMKSIGDLAKEFRKAQGWSYTRMAEEVSRHFQTVVSRQAITQLEAVGARKPHYISALAAVMNTSVDSLLAGHTKGAARLPMAVQTYEASIAHITAALKPLDAPARERAAVLLQGLARDPEGPWAAWLTELLASPGVQAPPAVPALAFKYTKVNQHTIPAKRKHQ